MFRHIGIAFDSDGRLVSRVRSGDDRAFSMLVSRYEAPAFALACAHVGASDAEDVVQEAFIRAYRKLDSLDDTDRFRGWFLTIVRRMCVDWQRARSKEYSAAQPAEAAVVPDPAHDEMREFLFKRLQNLEPDAREVLLLHYYGGASTREIAADIGISREAVKKRLQRAREELGNHLARDLDDLLKPRNEASKRRGRVLAALGLSGSAALTGGAQAASASWVWSGVTALLIAAIGYGIYSATNAAGTPVPPVESANATTPADPNAGIPTGDTSALLLAAATTTNGAAGNENQTGAAASEDDPNEPGPGIGSVLGVAYVYRTSNDERVPGARIVMERVDWQPHETPPSETYIRETIADENGAFHIDKLPLGNYVLRAYAEDRFDIREVTLGNIGFAKNLYVSLRPSTSMSGQVLGPDGEPVAGATLYSYRNAGEASERYFTARSSARFTTDDEGRFHVSHIWPGRAQFYIKAPGYATLLTDAVSTRDDDILWTLDRGDTAAVKVVDESGAPLPGVEVGLAASDARRDWLAAETAEDGIAFFANLREATYRVTLPDDKWTLQDGPVEVDTAADDEIRSLVASEGGSVAGRAYIGASEAALAGVRVRAEATEGNGEWPVETVTGADGVYELTGLAETPYSVTFLTPNGHAPVGEDTGINITPRKGTSIQSDVVCETTAALRGRVVNANGNGEPGVVVRVYSGTYSEELRSAALSGPGGAFSVPGLRDGTPYYAYAMTNNRIGPVEKGTLASNGETPLPLPIGEPATVAGIVVDENGQPAPGVRISASPREYIDIGMVMQYASIGSSTSEADAQGRFRITGLPPGAYRLNASDPDDNSFNMTNVGYFDLTAGQTRDDFTVVWQPATPTNATLTITGIVTDPKGQPVNRALVWANSASGDVRLHKSARTDTQGRFTVKELLPGSYSLHAELNGYSLSKSAESPAGSNGIVLQLRELGELLVRVSDAATGEPIQRFDIGHTQTFSGAPESRMRQMVRREGLQSINDASGEWRKKLSFQSTTVLVEADGYAPFVSEVRVPPASEGVAEVEAALVPAATLHVQVFEPGGAPARGARIHLDHFMQDDRLRDQFPLAGTTDALGEVLANNLTLGDHILIVEHETHGLARKEITLNSGQRNEVEFHLKDGATARTQILLDGRPVPQAWFFVRFGGENDWTQTLSGQSDTNGYVELRGLPEGTATATVQIRDPQNLYYARANEIPALFVSGQVTEIDGAMVSGTGALAGTFRVNGQTPRASSGQLRCHYPAHPQTAIFSLGTGNGGEFEGHGMPAGLMTVEARFYDPVTREPITRLYEVEIRDGETTNLDINIDYNP